MELPVIYLRCTLYVKSKKRDQVVCTQVHIQYQNNSVTSTTFSIFRSGFLQRRQYWVVFLVVILCNKLRNLIVTNNVQHQKFLGILPSTDGPKICVICYSRFARCLFPASVCIFLLYLKCFYEKTLPCF